MSRHNPRDGQNQYYQSPPRRAGGYRYHNNPDRAHPQQPAHQPGYPSRSESNNPYDSRPPAAPSSLPASGYPINMPQQDYTSYYPQQASQQHQTYPHPAAVHRCPPNSEYNNTNYHPPTNIPNHPPPAYDALYSPDEDSLEQAEPISSEQVHDAEAFVDEETLRWIPSSKNNRQQMRRLEVRSSCPLSPSIFFLSSY